MNNDNLLSDINERFMSLTRSVQFASCGNTRIVNGILDYRIDEERERYIQSEREVIIRYLPLNYDRKSCVISIGFMVPNVKWDSYQKLRKRNYTRKRD